MELTIMGLLAMARICQYDQGQCGRCAASCSQLLTILIVLVLPLVVVFGGEARLETFELLGELFEERHGVRGGRGSLE